MNILDLKPYMGEMVYEYVPGVKRHNGNKLNFRCPICGDGKKKTSHRGWFYLDSGSYLCWNAGCPAEGGMSGLKFLSLVSGKSISEIRSELIKKAGSFSSAIDKCEIKDMSNSLFDDNKKPKSVQRYILDKIELNEWTDNLPLFAKKYLEERKLNMASFLPPSFKFYYDKKLKRLVIPWSNEYYQERLIFSSKKDDPKYIFPQNVEKPLFGEECIDKNFKYIFLVEGVFDSIWVKNGLAVGSLTLSNHQREILKKYENDFTIVYLMDNQFADNSSMEKTKKLADKEPFTNIFIWPKVLHMFKDINDTIIFNDKFIDIWKDEEFLKKYICSGLKVKLNLNA